MKPKIGKITIGKVDLSKVTNPTPSTKPEPDLIHDPFQSFTACNWEEDYFQENGNYVNKCSVCGFNFRGNKHRHVCKMCSNAEPDFEKMAEHFSDSFPIAPKSEGKEAYRLGLKDGYCTAYSECWQSHFLPLQEENKRISEKYSTEKEEAISQLYDYERLELRHASVVQSLEASKTIIKNQHSEITTLKSRIEELEKEIDLMNE